MNTDVSIRGTWTTVPALFDLVLRLGAASALAIDAYGHAADASFYPSRLGGGLAPSTLFLVEAAVASTAALLLVGGWRITAWRRAVWAFAFLVAASALGGVVLYTNVDVGTLGPIPNMYEPTWAVPNKRLTAYAEGVAVVLTATGLALTQVRMARRMTRALA